MVLRRQAGQDLRHQRCHVRLQRDRHPVRCVVAAAALRRVLRLVVLDVAAAQDDARAADLLDVVHVAVAAESLDRLLDQPSGLQPVVPELHAARFDLRCVEDLINDREQRASG